MTPIAVSNKVNTHAFIVTKPLQIIVSLSIIRQLEIANMSHVVVVDRFSNARRVWENLKSYEGAMCSLSTSFAATSEEAYRFLRNQRFSAIFIDSDVGLRRYLDLITIRLNNPDVDINVYEEGLGTYRTDLYDGIKKHLLRFLGIGTHFGGCKLTSAIYLYEPDEYSQLFPKPGLDVHQIAIKPVDFIESFFGDICQLFEYLSSMPRAKEARCNVYLPSWSINELFINIFEALDGDNYVKPHPHARTFSSERCTTIAPEVPAEILLFDLKNKYDIVNVYHNGSSVERYVEYPNINYVRI